MFESGLAALLTMALLGGVILGEHLAEERVRASACCPTNPLQPAGNLGSMPPRKLDTSAANPRRC
jgi:hypothetical protein